MDAETDPTPSVVVATDGSSHASAAVEWAAAEAASRREPLLIVSACPPEEVSAVLDAAGQRAKEHQEIVSTAADRVRKHYPDVVVTTEIFYGDPRGALELYEKLASVVVLGSRGLGSVRSLLLGSVSFWATRHLRVPFVVVRPPDPERLSTPRGIAVGIGSYASSETTLHVAFQMAARRACPLTIANAAWDEHVVGNTWTVLPVDEVEPRRRRAVMELTEKIAAEFPTVDYAVLFARGRVDYFLASLGRRHETLVLGRRESTLLDFIGLGTLATFVVEHGVGATLVVPVEGGRP